MAREHRLSARVPLELPVQLRWKTTTGKSRQVDARTGNISANGMFVTVPHRLRHNAPIAFRVNLPSEITRTPVQLQGHGRIVRRSGPGQAPGVAAIIDEYEIRPAGNLSEAR
jgi:hypothetical protein